MSHIAVGGLIAFVAPAKIKSKRFYAYMTLLPVVPDLDVVGAFLGIQYGDFLGHRGFTHSAFFAFSVALASVYFLFPKKRDHRPLITAFLFASLFSHAVLDAMTNGGLGVAFFSPFNLKRYFFSFRPVEVSPVGLHFFSARGLDVLRSEIIWIITPGVALALSWWAMVRTKAK